MFESTEIGYLLRALTVKVSSPVESGSGVLCRPSPKSSFVFVLTARHIVADGGTVVLPNEISLEFYTSPNPAIYILQKNDRVLAFDDPKKDIAVLVVPLESVELIIGELPVVYLVQDSFGLKKCLFRGFPEAGEGVEPFRMEGEITESEKTTEFQFELEVNRILDGKPNSIIERTAKQNIDGYSGSGVFLVNDNEIYLFGVVSAFGPFNRFLGVKVSLLEDLFLRNEICVPIWKVPEVRPEVRLGVKRLAQNNRDAVRGRISASIDGQWHIERIPLLEDVFQKIQDNAFLMVSGEAGVGKSAFMEEIIQSFLEPGGWHIWAFRGEQLCHGSIGESLRNIGIQASAADLISSPLCIGNLLIWLDGAEKLVESMKFEAFLDVVRLIQQKPDTKIVVTLRKFSAEHFRMRMMNLLQPVLFNLPPLSDVELADTVAKFPQLELLLRNPKLKKLLRLPFYLNFAVKLPKLSSDEGQKLDEGTLRAKMWTLFVENGNPVRAKQFEEIVLRRASSFSLFGLPETPDYTALQALEQDHIIVREESGNMERYAPAHDIFEDWALIRHVQRCWDSRQTPEIFIVELGNTYAIRRGFRHWLEENLSKENLSIVTFLGKILESDVIEPLWKDEIMVRLLQSSLGSKFLQSHSTRLFENNGEGLGRLLRIFRTATKEPLTGSGGLRSEEERWRLYSMNFQPVGPGWGTLVWFICGNFDAIPDKRLIANFLQDWGNQIVPYESLPEAAREVALSLLKLLDGWKTKYGHGRQDGHDKQIKDCVRLLFRLTEAAKDETRDLLELASRELNKRDIEGWQTNKFYELLLESAFSYFFSQQLCLHLPDTIIALANAHWKQTYSREEIIRYPDFLNKHKEYGLAHDRWIRYNPESAYQTPIYWLLTFHPLEALAFLVDLFNYASRKYREANYENNEPAYQISITLNDGRRVQQWGNYTHFAMYRGQVIAPDLLKSCLMALEKWLLELAEDKDEKFRQFTGIVFDFLLDKSESVAISGVLTSVAIAYPEAVGDRILPFLTAREFFEWDFSRWTSDMHSFALGGFFEFDKTHQQERINSNKLPHRKTPLMRHIVDVSWRNPEIRKKFEVILDGFYQELDPDDLTWKKWLTDMDLRTWEVAQEFVSEEGNPGFIVQPKYEPEVAKMVSQTQSQVQSDVPIGNASMWGLKMFKREAVENSTFEKWVECYENLKPSWKNPDSLRENARFIHFYPAGLAAVGVRDFLKNLTSEQKAWCEEVLLNRAEYYVLGERDPMRFDLGKGSSSFDNEPANLSLVELLRPEFDEATRQKVATLLFECLCVFSTENNLLTSFFAHVRENLWNIAPEIGVDCWHGLIAFARLQKERFDSKVDWPHYPAAVEKKRLKRQESFNNRESEFKAKVLEGDFRVNPAEISFETHGPWRLDSAFLILPDNYQQADFHVFTRQYLEILVARLSTQRKYGDDNSRFYWSNIHFAERFAYYLLLQPAEKSDAAFQQFLNHAFRFQKSWYRDEGFEFFDRCFEQLIVAADQMQDGTGLQRLWKLFYQKIKETGFQAYLTKLFLDLRWWKSGISHWKPIEGSEAFFQRAILDFGTKEFNSVLRLLSGIGSQTLLPQSLEQVNVILPQLQDDNWDIFEAEKLLQRLYYTYYQEIRQDNVLFSYFLALLDIMVSKDSSLAFFVRESCFGRTNVN